MATKTESKYEHLDNESSAAANTEGTTDTVEKGVKKVGYLHVRS